MATSREKLTLKTALIAFLFIIFTLASSLLTLKVINSNYKLDASNVVNKLYEYKKSHKKFPTSLDLFDLSNRNYLYQVDSPFVNFSLCYKEVPDLPTCFNTKDSTWHH